MCDLFALSASHHHIASTSLPLFAVRGRQNVHGWGIGFFRHRTPVVEKSGDQVFADGRLHVSFQRLARVVNSPIILAHIRYKSSGEVDECHAHPFVLDFWDQAWIFAHNGKAPIIEPYVSPNTPLLEAASDSARTFEFLRDYFWEAEPRRPHTPFGVILKEALVLLLKNYPGGYNFLLTNGRVIWAFTNHRQFMMLKGSEKLEDALLLTTIEEGLSSENWQRLAAGEGSLGRLLLIAGGDLILSEDLRP
ncbi:MAG: class II glutamine amidotransferase [Desulfobaccales bacterium]